MKSISYEELDEDEDGWVQITLTIISGDPALLNRARKAFRSIADDTPRLSAVNGPRSDDNG